MTTWIADRADHTAWFAEQSLRRYIEAVALAIGLPADGVGSELADTATGYIALTARSLAFPGRDLMLIWTGNGGWALATEDLPSRTSQPTSRTKTKYNSRSATFGIMPSGRQHTHHRSSTGEC